MRFRSTALPVFFVTVIPSRGGPSSPRSSTSRRNKGPRRFAPRCTARNSARLVRRSGARPGNALPHATEYLGRNPLATTGATCRNHAAAALGGHTRAKSMPALANEFRGLISALHLFNTAACGPSSFCLDEQEHFFGRTGRKTTRRAASPNVRGL